MPVKVVLSPTTTITLDVYTDRSTADQQREITRTLKKAVAVTDAKEQELYDLQTQALLSSKPLRDIGQEAALLEEEMNKTDGIEGTRNTQDQIIELRQKLSEARKKIAPQLAEMDEKIETLQEEIEDARHAVIAQELAFYVASSDVTESDGQQIPVNVDFFLTYFSAKMLAKSAEAVREARNGPLVIPSNTDSS